MFSLGLLSIFLILITYLYYKYSKQAMLNTTKQSITNKTETEFINEINSVPSPIIKNHYIKEYTNRISITSYNILNQKFVKKRPLNKHFSLDNRMDRILKELNEISSDIICLQEVDYKVLEKYIRGNLKQYEFIYGENDGSSFLNVIGYKNTYHKLFSQSLDLKDINIIGNRGVLKLTLKDRKGNIFVVYNVHFPWNPKYELYKCQIMNIIFENILKTDCDNVFIVGDFNSLPDSVNLKMIYIDHYTDKSISNKNSNNKKSNKNKNKINSNNHEHDIVKENNKVKNTLNSEFNGEFNGDTNEIFNIKDRKEVCKEVIKEVNKEVEEGKLELLDKTNKEYNFNEINIKMKHYDQNKDFYDKFEQNALNLNEKCRIRSSYENYQIYYNNKKGEFPNYIKHHPEFTNFTECFQGTLDYIFYSKQYVPIKLLKLPTKNDIIKEEYLPNSIHPSDHVKIYCEFKY